MVLAGKTAVITGGASGIGAAIARLLASNGATIIIADLDGEQARSVADAIGNGATAVKVDVANVVEIREVTSKLYRVHDYIDILVNSAGVVVKRDFLDCEPEDLDRVVGVNLRGTFFFSQALARRMRERGGRIVNIGSISGLQAFDTRAVYGSSKAAVLQLTRNMAIELAQYGIMVNAIAPGPIETPLVAAAHDDQFRSRVMDRIPARRYGTAEDVAGTALFLASDQATYLTGQVIAVDGGYTASGLSTQQPAD